MFWKTNYAAARSQFGGSLIFWSKKDKQDWVVYWKSLLKIYLLQLWPKISPWSCHWGWNMCTTMYLWEKCRAWVPKGREPRSNCKKKLIPEEGTTHYSSTQTESYYQMKRRKASLGNTSQVCACWGQLSWGSSSDFSAGQTGGNRTCNWTAIKLDTSLHLIIQCSVLYTHEAARALL